MQGGCSAEASVVTPAAWNSGNFVPLVHAGPQLTCKTGVRQPHSGGDILLFSSTTPDPGSGRGSSCTGAQPRSTIAKSFKASSRISWKENFYCEI